LLQWPENFAGNPFPAEEWILNTPPNKDALFPMHLEPTDGFGRQPADYKAEISDFSNPLILFLFPVTS